MTEQLGEKWQFQTAVLTGGDARVSRSLRVWVHRVWVYRVWVCMYKTRLVVVLHILRLGRARIHNTLHTFVAL